MNESLHTSNGIHDIVQPAMPPDTTLFFDTGLVAMLILLILLTVLFIRHYNSSRMRARRRLNLLYRSFNKNISDPETIKAMAYQLSDILASGIGLKGVTTATALPNELSRYHARWQHFTSTLSTMRYARQGNYDCNLNEMFRESYFWLKHWP